MRLTVLSIAAGLPTNESRRPNTRSHWTRLCPNLRASLALEALVSRAAHSQWRGLVAHDEAFHSSPPPPPLRYTAHCIRPGLPGRRRPFRSRLGHAVELHRRAIAAERRLQVSLLGELMRTT